MKIDSGRITGNPEVMRRAQPAGKGIADPGPNYIAQMESI